MLLLGAAAEPRWIALNRAAGEASRAKDYAKLRDALVAMEPLLPGNSRIVYNLACAYARFGQPGTAIAGLSRLAAMGLVYDLAADPDLASLKDRPEFREVEQRMAANRKPVTHATLVATLPERDLIPEDLAYDPRTRRFLIASVRRAAIFASDGRLFAKAPWSVLALRVDASRSLVWAASGWTAQCESCALADKDKSALLAFDLDSGALRQRVDSPVKGLLGDMTISRAGDLYVSEGMNGALLRLRVGAGKLERLDTGGEFPSPQTPALSADEKTLYVPDYVRGIAAVSLADLSVRWLQPAGNLALSGIDGLYTDHGSFLAVQNGIAPARIVRFAADLSRQEVLETNTAWLGEPTHGTVVDGAFYFLADTGWNNWGEDGKKKPGTSPTESTVRMIK